MIARPEPENSILEIITAYLEKPRPYRLVILGKYSPEVIPYHGEVLRIATHPQIDMLGSIYDASAVRALRFHALAYVHGHQVGGTNPSLVESMACGNAVFANDNAFNRWVTGPEAGFFKDAAELSMLFTRLTEDPEALRVMRSASRARSEQCFMQEDVLQAYEQLLVDGCLKENRWEIGDNEAVSVD